MSDYSISELNFWNGRIEDIIRGEGLDCYEQEFEIVGYDDMIGYEAYTGMPSHYPHWSYGKAFERIKTLNKYNLSGLPYEMVINSDPCIAYLMKDNTLLLQILTIAHVYGHNDFFKSNRLFKSGARAGYTVEMFKNHADRIREYISDPGVGYAKVEKILNAAHALKFQTVRVVGAKRVDEEERKKMLLRKSESSKYKNRLLEPPAPSDNAMPDLKKIPLEPEEDLLRFILEYGKLSDWEKDIISIVMEETQYFIPQIETKVMNEGWASFWHYTILNRLELSQKLHMEFLKRHNQIIRPFEGSINPYFLGFKIFEDLMKRSGKEKILEARELERDESFIRRYLTCELCREMNLIEYLKSGNEYVVSEVSDEEGWKKIRETIASSAGMGSIPMIRVSELVKRDNTLLLEHLFDGRELDLNYAYEALKHVVDLWDGKVVLDTFIDDKKRVVICDEQKKISIAN